MTRGAAVVGTVFLTRPAGRNEALARRLRDAGVPVREAPALAIRFLDTQRPPAAAGDLHLFVSRQAVEAYFAAVSSPWPAGAWAGAVGPATAGALGLHVPAGQVLVPAGDRAPDSESLLATIDARQLLPATAHVLRAQQGRNWMAEQLRLRGWRVCEHALYERSPVRWDVGTCQELAGGDDRVLLVTSQEAADAIESSLRFHAVAWPGRLRAVTLHTRISRRLQCWYADRPADALCVTVSVADDAALYDALLSAARLP